MTTITISRHYGSGGRKIAARVRELLDYRFFDSLFMTQIASQVALSRAEIVDFSEEDYKVKSFLERLLSFNPAEMVVSPSSAKSLNLDVPRFDDADSVNLVKLTVRAAYERGNMVIVGRGAQVILRDQPHVLHVRIIAPLETRLKRLQEIEGLSQQKARRQIEEHDKAGREYLSRFFNVQWDDPYLYHLTINTGLYDTEQAAQLIVVAARQLVEAASV
jgi:CMP/dCMP kinase